MAFLSWWLLYYITFLLYIASSPLICRKWSNIYILTLACWRHCIVGQELPKPQFVMESLQLLRYTINNQLSFYIYTLFGRLEVLPRSLAPPSQTSGAKWFSAPNLWTMIGDKRFWLMSVFCAGKGQSTACHETLTKIFIETCCEGYTRNHLCI